MERSRKLFLEGGEAAFFKPRRGRGLSALTPERTERATACRGADERWPTRSASPRHRSATGSTRDWSAAGRTGTTGSPSRTGAHVTSATAVMGRATSDTIGRVLASIRQAGGTGVHTGARRAVACSPPALLREGLLSTTELLSPMPRGYYGLATIFLCIAFMFMARIRTPESLRYHAPGEWGAILGHAPEAKTLRNKISLIANDEARAWQSALASQWQAGELGDPVRRWSRQGLCRPQGPSSQALRRAPEAVPAGQHQLLGQRPRRSAAALPAQAAGSEDGLRP